MIKNIAIDRGLVTARDPALLEEGELSLANDCYYLPDDPALQRAWGRTRYLNSNAQIAGGAGKVLGLAYCPFDNVRVASDDFIVAHFNGKYYVSVWTARTGSLSGTTIDSVGTGDHLEGVFANNRWYLFNGNQNTIANYVLKPGTTNPASRTHGLAPVPIFPTSPAVTTAVGSWPRDEAFWGEGRFFFFTTEVVRPGDVDELESAADFGTPPHVDLTKDASGNINFNVIVTRHTPLANSAATEVRVYMVKASLYQAWDMSLLARAFRVGTITVSATPANDKLTLSANYTFYDPTTAPASIVDVTSTVTSEANMGANDGAAGTFPENVAGTVRLTNWGFALPASSVVVGVIIWVKAKGNGGGIVVPRTLSTAPIHGAGPTVGVLKSKGVFIDNTYRPHTFGSETDNFGLTLTETQVNATTFGVQLQASALGQTCDVDSVSLRVFTSTVPTIGPAYPIVALQTGNVLTIHSANTPPPTSDTGAIIDGCLVVNDVSIQGGYAWSLPTQYDYFPEPYRGRLDGVKDSIKAIRKVGNVGLLVAEHSIHRLNFVPLSTDPEFIPGRALELIVPNHGAVSKQGVALFQPHGNATFIAYVSHNGVYMNDGQQDDLMTGDIKWETMVDVTKLAKAVLIDYPKKHVLKLIFAESSSTENNKYLLIHYHRSHRKPNGAFKVTGPCSLAASCATLARLGAEHVLLTGHATENRIYVEDNGVSDTQASGAINMLFQTREIYPWGIAMRGTVKFGHVHQNGAGPLMPGSSTQYYRTTGVAQAAATAVAFTPDISGLKLLHQHLGVVEAVAYRISLPDAGVNNAAVAFNFLVHDVDEHGKALG